MVLRLLYFDYLHFVVLSLVVIFFPDVSTVLMMVFQVLILIF